MTSIIERLQDEAPHSACPTADSLAAYFGRAAGLEDDRSSIEAHLATCEMCRQVVAALAREPSRGTPPSGTSPEAPARHGRYVVGSRVGAGAMGVVYAAYDPELDRQVAIKLLHPQAGLPDHARLLREAKAMARLAHPNIVAVHDVGVTSDDRLWLAMELVRGQPLDVWIQASKRTWQVVLGLMIQAGRGLRAVHAAGLLHRDFKPANVMVESTDEGDRARITDFGLVRVTGPEPASHATVHAATIEDALGVTRRGSLVGTPVDMSPEQLRGDAATERSDQFSYCVTMWEALFGTRPFAGQSLTELTACVMAGKPLAPPRGRAPTWLRLILQRGLSTAREGRWPSMDALLDALERGRTRARWRRALATCAGAGVVGVACFGWQQLDHAQQVAACEDEGAEIGSVWNDRARTELRDAIAATRLAYAERTSDKLLPWLDRYAEQWQAARTRACLDAEDAPGWDAEMSMRREHCLDARRMEFEALVSELTRVTGVEKAVQAAASLTAIDTCAELETLRHRSPAPVAIRDELRAITGELWRANALRRTGSLEAALVVSRETVAHAERLGWTPMTAEARFELGLVLENQGHYADAAEVLETAYFEAARTGADEIAARAAESLARTVGVDLARHDDGIRWSKLAEVLEISLPDPAQVLVAKHSSHLGKIYEHKGMYAEALALFERALEIDENALGAEHPQVAADLGDLARLQRTTGSLQEAEKLTRRALSIRSNALGDEHPDVAASLLSLGLIHDAAGDHAEADATLRRALAISERSLGPRHRKVGTTLTALASVHVVIGNDDEAEALYRRALTILETSLGPDHPEVALCLSDLGSVVQGAGRYDEAKSLHERALAIAQTSSGPEHPLVGMILGHLAALHHTASAYELALPLYERALAITEAAGGPEHVDVAALLSNLAALHVDAGRPATAKPLFARAQAIYENALGLEHPEIAVSLTNAAEAYLETNEFAGAEQRYRRALAILENTVGADHPNVALALRGLTLVALAEPGPTDAVQLAERLLRWRERNGASPLDRSEALFLLARALWDAKQDRRRALELAEQARAGYGEGEAAKEVATWLGARRRR